MVNIIFLRLVHQTRTHKRRVAHYIIQLAFGYNAFPISAQGVALYNISVGFQRQKVQRHKQNFFGFLHHLAFGNPECGFGNRHCKIVDFNAVKLADGNLYRAFTGGVHRHLSVGKFQQDFIFQPPQT